MAEAYLVKTSIGNRSKRQVWHDHEPLTLDSKGLWLLEKTEAGYQARELNDPKRRNETKRIILIPDTTAEFEIELTHRGLATPVSVSIAPLTPIRPAYLPQVAEVIPGGAQRPSVLFIFYGVKHFLVRYKRTGGGYRAVVDRKRVFDCVRTETGFDVTAYKDDLYLKHEGNLRNLQNSIVESISEEEFTQGTLVWGIHWWRINRIPIPPALPPKEEDEEIAQDKKLYRRIRMVITASFAILCLVVWFAPRPKPVPKKVFVELKAPKVIPKVPEPEPPAPPPPPKVVEVTPPKPKPKPVPEKVAVAPPQPAPKSVPMKKPPPVAPPVVSAPPKVDQSKQLADSLKFLSPSQNRSAANMPLPKNPAKYDSVTGLVSQKQPNALNKLAAAGLDTSAINTKGARDINGNVNLTGSYGKGKSLNKVQGRVALNERGGDLSGSLNAKGLSMSGSGQIAEALLEKVLAAHLQQFQYCYEKALLTDSSLSGSLVMQWTVMQDGSANEIRVVRSQLNNAGLHDCISRELSKIKFPVPSGGTVSIKYPLSFSSASL
jgi:hypothetical protein